MKALSLKQPWLTWIVEGVKTIETRTWATSYRGPLLLCSSRQIDKSALPISLEFGRRETFDPAEFPVGLALATCSLDDCRPMTPDDEKAARCACEPGRWAWIISCVRRIDEPFRVKGQLGLFEVEMPTRRDNVVVVPP